MDEFYVLNFVLDIAYTDESVSLKVFGNRIRIKGESNSKAIRDILNYFKSPSTLECAVVKFSSDYSHTSISKLLQYLIDKKILIKESEQKELLGNDLSLIKKLHTYTIGGLSLAKIKDKLASMSICLIGPIDLVKHLLENLTSNDLLVNFHIVTTDGLYNEVLIPEFVNIISIYEGVEISRIEDCIRRSDFTFVGADHHNHYLFDKVNSVCLSENKKWIRMVLDFTRVEIGPIFIPHETCCYMCLLTRSRQFMDAEEYALDDLKLSPRRSGCLKEDAIKFSYLYPLNSLAASIATSETIKYLLGMKCNLPKQIMEVDLLDFQIHKSPAYKDYKCLSCVKG